VRLPSAQVDPAKRIAPLIAQPRNPTVAMVIPMMPTSLATVTQSALTSRSTSSPPSASGRSPRRAATTSSTLVTSRPAPMT
jgi:hypothetical protein